MLNFIPWVLLVLQKKESSDLGIGGTLPGLCRVQHMYTNVCTKTVTRVNDYKCTVYINLHTKLGDIPIKSQCLIAFSISGNRSLNVDLKTSTIICIIKYNQSGVNEVLGSIFSLYIITCVQNCK